MRIYCYLRVFARAAFSSAEGKLYLCTRHFFAWYSWNVLELEPHVIAAQLGHGDGGSLVRRLYGHPDAAIARRKIREAFESTATVTTLRPAAQAS